VGWGRIGASSNQRKVNLRIYELTYFNCTINS
jgi:hypothetical protein